MVDAQENIYPRDWHRDWGGDRGSSLIEQHTFTMSGDPRALLAKVFLPERSLQKADQKAASRGGFFGGSSTSRYEEAAELYTQAANAFRLQKQGALPPHNANKR
jgi:Soluble NSF attachment protein, SNAP